LSSDPDSEEAAENVVNVSRHPECNDVKRKIAENYDWNIATILDSKHSRV
jgi:hypothetical protein